MQVSMKDKNWALNFEASTREFHGKTVYPKQGQKMEGCEKAGNTGQNTKIKCKTEFGCQNPYSRRENRLP